MKLEIINELNESRLIGYSRTGLRKYTAKDLAELFLLHICALQIMKYEFVVQEELQKYIERTGNLINFDNFLATRTEIYLMMHIFTGRNADPQIKMLKDYENSKIFIDRVNINIPYMRKYLRMIKYGINDESFERKFLLMLEQQLLISNSYYRSIRRLVSSWRTQPESTKRLVMTRLLQFLRTRARRSELLPYLEKLSKKEKYEDKTLDKLDTKKRKQGPSIISKIGAATAGSAAGLIGGYKLGRG